MKVIAVILALTVPSAAFTPQSAWVRRSSHLILSSDAAPAVAEGAPVDVQEAPPAAAPATKMTLDSVEVDGEYEGTVKGVSDFGAFVDFGLEKMDGLVHKSQLSDDYVTNPSDVVSVGQTVSVRVLSVDLEKKQISLSMKSKGARAKKTQSKGPDLSKYEAMSQEEQIDGVVRTVMAYGAFVDFPDGATGLVHISQLAETRTENAEDVVSVGDSVKVRVISADGGKLSLSMKAYNPDAPPERPKGRRRNDGEGGGGMERRQRKEQIDDIWSDNTEPKWVDFQSELNGAKEQYDNVIELKL